MFFRLSFNHVADDRQIWNMTGIAYYNILLTVSALCTLCKGCEFCMHKTQIPMTFTKIVQHIITEHYYRVLSINYCIPICKALDVPMNFHFQWDKINVKD